MKARFLALAALVLGLASCQNDFEAGNIVAGGEVDFQLSVGADELATRAGKDGNDTLNGWNSAYGAIDYLKAEADAHRVDWTDVDLRYTLEVYDVTKDADGNNVVTNLVPVKDRQVKIVDAYEPVVFDLRLVPNRDYRFVVFADFVAQGATANPTVDDQAMIGLRHNIGNTLQEITVKENDDDDKRLNDEVADAYFAFEDIKITNSNAQNMVLRRPYGKLRVIATDLAELNLNVEPNEVKVTYTAANPNKFNAVTGEIEVDNTPVEYVIHYNSKAGKTSLAEYTYTEGYDAKTVQNANNETRHSHITLFTDYILAEAEQNPINFTMEVFDRDGGIIKETVFNTAIPVQRNYLTTVIGNVLTTATEIDVRIDDNFADENGEPQLHTILETLINGGEFTLTEDLEINVPTTLTGDAIINLNGHKLTYTIPADCEDNTSYMIMTRVANGSSLTFVGDGEVVSDGYIASANEGGKVYVNGGNYSGDTCTLFQANGGEVYIYGGEFKAAEYNGDYRYTLNHVDSKKNVGKIEVTGGKFYKYDPAQSASENPVMDFVPKGIGAYPEGDWYVVKPVSEANYTAKLTPNTNDSVKALIAAIFHNGGELTIERNVNHYDDVATFDKALIAAKGDVVLNFTGTDLADDAYLKADYVYVENKVAALISAQDGTTVTINGNGNIDGGADDYAVEARNGGKVVLNGGNYVGAATAVQAAYNGEVTINGGTYSLNESVDTFGYTYLLNLKDNTNASIKVYGGKFKNFNPMDNAAENPKVSFCADGCSVYKKGAYYEVYNVGANVTIDAVVTDTTELESALADANVKVIYLKSGIYGTIKAKSNKTIIGSTAADVECVALNGADNVTLINIEFDAADAKLAYNGKGKGTQPANIISGDINKNASGSRNLVIDGCKFTGTFADGGVAIAFTDQSRTSGQSGNITIKNCTFETKNGYCDIYCYYSGYGEFVIENNVFNSELLDKPIYLGRYQSSTPVVVKGNTFARCATFNEAAYIQDHSNYGVSFDASNNTFAN